MHILIKNYVIFQSCPGRKCSHLRRCLKYRLMSYKWRVTKAIIDQLLCFY